MIEKHRKGIGCLSAAAAVFLLLSFFGRQAFPADPLETWHVRSFLPGSDLYGVTYANGLYVAVGNNGTLTTSRDQVNWTARPLVSDTGLAEPCLYAVTYGNGLFVAVGTYIWTSPDGVAWTHRPCPVQQFGGVAYGNGRFVAAGGSHRVYNSDAPPPSCATNPTECAMATSNDGITWTDRSSTSGLTTEPTVGLVFADGKFVQLGWHQPPYYSLDGLTFTPAQGTNSSLYNHGAALTYGNGLFVFVGNYLDCGYGGTVNTSPDGITWTRYAGPAFTSVGSGSGMFLATAATCPTTQTPPSVYHPYKSTDGVTWTGQSNSMEGYGIAASPGSLTVVGGDMSILTTPDGVTWTSHAGGLTIEARAVAFGNGTFVTAGTGGRIYTSPDGVAWTGRTNPSLAGKNFESVVYGGNGWVAVGLDASSGTPSVASSPDGIDWVQAGQPGAPVGGLAYGNGVYVGTGGSTVYSSNDGVSWTARATDPSGALSSVAFGNGKFVAVGDKSIMTSPDGMIWTAQPSGTGRRLTGVAAGNKLFAAVSSDETAIRVSPDGVSWTDRPSGIESGGLGDIAFGAGRFVAIGDQGAISYSSDGQAWTAQSLGQSGAVRAIAFGNSTFVAAGGNTILQSDPVPAPPEPATVPQVVPASSDPTPAASSSGGGGGGGCFIATAAYGGGFAWQVEAFKEFRDKHLLTSRIGRLAVAFYYAASPPLAAAIADRPALRLAVRLFLTPVAYGVKKPVPSAALVTLCLFLALWTWRSAGNTEDYER